MNILFLSPYPPYPPHGGGTMRIYQLIRGLAARHVVTCLTFAPDADAEQALAPLREYCRVLVVRGPEPRSTLRRAWTTLRSPLPDMALRNASAAYAAALHALLARETFDVIQAESIEMAMYLQNQEPRTKNPLIARRSASQFSVLGSTLVLDQFNAEFMLQKRAALTSLRALWSNRSAPAAAARHAAASAYSLAQWQKLARYERRVMSACDAVVAVSDDDRRTLQTLAPAARIGVVPNGVDTAEFSRAAPGNPMAFRSPALVFTGTLDFRPNIDAALWFAREVLPHIRARRPDACFVVVGKRPAPAVRVLAADGATIIVGAVPDARPFIAGAAVYVVPMRIGGGVRLKLLEALSLEAPVVSTGMGAEGVAGLRDSEHCLLADQPEQFAGAVLRLLDDRVLARQLGAAGRALVRERYDWTTIVPQLEQVYT